MGEITLQQGCPQDTLTAKLPADVRNSFPALNKYLAYNKSYSGFKNELTGFDDIESPEV